MILFPARLSLAAALGVGAVVAFGLAISEARIVDIEIKAARGEMVPTGTCARGCPTRVQIALARIVTDAALRAPSTGAANPDLDAIIFARPRWPKALVERAYWLSAREPGTPASIAALDESYRATPFLRDAALWRVDQVVADWARMPASLRKHAMAEADWYGGIDNLSQERMNAVIAGSPIEVARLLRAARDANRLPMPHPAVAR